MDCSIVMITQATYPKRLGLLKHTLMTLGQNTLYPFELIVVDNGPKKQTEYLKTCDIDRHIINKKNVGMGAARNQGAEVSDSEYIAFIDNDLVFRKYWLKESIELLKRHDKIIISPAYTTSMKDLCNRMGELDGYSLWSLTAGFCQVFKRKDFDEIGPWDKAPREDREYAKRAVAKGYSYMLLSPPKVRHIGRKCTWRGKKW